MPEYLWIIPSSVILLLLVGFAAGHWFSNKEMLAIVESFQEKLDKVIQKLNSLERLVAVPKHPAQTKSNVYTPPISKYSQFKEDILTIGDRLERIIRFLDTNPRAKDLKIIKEEPKITIGHRRDDENIVSDNASGAFEKSPSSSADEPEENQTYNSHSGYQAPNIQISQLYNRGVDDRSDRDLFREKYAMIRLGNNKAVELRLGEISEPEFRELDNGNFLAVSGMDDLFYVLPRFDTTLNSSAYNEGGFGYVFDCPGYNPELTYTIVRVKRPAVFRRDGGNWVRTEKGELILQL